MTDYKGKIFIAQLTHDVHGPWQQIALNSVETEQRKAIERAYSQIFPLNQRSIPRMAKAAQELSLLFERRLPYIGSENVCEFMKLPLSARNEAWKQYAAHYSKPRQLSQITNPDYQSCITHGLNILLTIQDDGWKPFHEFSGPEKKSRHLSLAKEVEDFMIVIDIQRGLQLDKYQSDALYAQPYYLFHRRYFAANILTKAELQALRKSMK